MISRVCTGKPYTFAMFSAHALHGKWGTPSKKRKQKKKKKKKALILQQINAIYEKCYINANNCR